MGSRSGARARVGSSSNSGNIGSARDSLGTYDPPSTASTGTGWNDGLGLEGGGGAGGDVYEEYSGEGEDALLVAAEMRVLSAASAETASFGIGSNNSNNPPGSRQINSRMGSRGGAESRGSGGSRDGGSRDAEHRRADV